VAILVVRLVATDGLQQQRRVGLERLGAELLAIVEVEHGRLNVQAQTGNLAFKAQADAFVGLHVDDQPVGARSDVAAVDVAEQLRRRLEVDDELGELAPHALARAQEEGHALPAPVVDEEFECRKCVARAVGRHVGFLAIAARTTAPSISARAYWARTASRGTSSGEMGRTASSTWRCSLRRSEARNEVGGSMATTAMSCSRWLWIMSRMAPAEL
jgi:hypothetical protein